MRIVVGLIMALLIAAPASAQPASGTGAPAAVQPTTKRVDCRADAQGKGLRGQEARDAVALCVQELRLTCLKEAIGKKVVGKDRRAFMTACAGRPGQGGKADEG